MHGRLLVAYDCASNYIPTFCEYLNSIGTYSSWEVRYVHVTHGAQLDFDLNDFDAIFHNYCARLDVDGYCSDDYLEKLKRFRGVKLLSTQDEWDRPDKVRDAIHDFGFQIVFSCVTEGMIDRVYPPEMFPRTTILPVLAGFVPDHLAERGKSAPPLEARPIHIGYRGREIGARYGRLGFLKFEIGRRMREICELRGIPHDIEWAADKRIYGEGWYDFIVSCRSNLGTEGGCNVFDFGGEIEATYQKLSAERGAPVPYEEFRHYIDPVETQYDCGQLTPRLLEAAALRTPLVLFPGKYSGLIRPDEHYIELLEDFSNIDSVLARLRDLPGLAAMADRTYQRLVGSGEFSYRRFVAMIDGLLAGKAVEIGIELRPARKDHCPEIGSDLGALASFREQPTRGPRAAVYYEYKAAARENALYKAEIAKLNDVYPAEIARLNRLVDELNGRIAKLRWGFGAFADRYAVTGWKGALVIKTLLGNSLGCAALAEAIRRRHANLALLLQLAQVIAARGRAPSCLSLRPNGAGCDLVSGAGEGSVPVDEFVAALSARQLPKLTLVLDEKAGRGHLLRRDRYELPDLLEWLFACPGRALQLGLASAPPKKSATFSADASAEPAFDPGQ